MSTQLGVKRIVLIRKQYRFWISGTYYWFLLNGTQFWKVALCLGINRIQNFLCSIPFEKKTKSKNLPDMTRFFWIIQFLLEMVSNENFKLAELFLFICPLAELILFIWPLIGTGHYWNMRKWALIKIWKQWSFLLLEKSNANDLELKRINLFYMFSWEKTCNVLCWRK